MKRVLTTIAVVALFIGCANLYTGIVTVTEVRDSAMKELAALHKAGYINAEKDAQIANADARYRAAALTARNALVSWKNGGDQASYITALEIVRASVSDLIGLLLPYTPPGRVTELSNTLKKASAP